MTERDVLGDAIERLGRSQRDAIGPGSELARHGVGPGSELARDGVGTGSELDRDGVGTASELARITRRTALTGGAAGLAAALLEACGSSSGTPTATAADSSSAAAVFAPSGSLKFTLVSHATSSSFFVPTQNGAADACKLLGCSYRWTGSETSEVTQMISAINNAVSEKVNGIATTLIDPTAFDTPVQDALDAEIPVVAYNSDVPGNPRLAYIGQNLYLSGRQVGEQIVTLLPHGGDIAIFAATPRSSSLQPRIEGIEAVLAGHRGIRHRVVSSGATEPEQVSTIDAYIDAHPTYNGFFGVEGGSTAAVATAIQRYGLKARGVVGGGYDVTPTIEQAVASGEMQFTIDQQPYLQGFLPILELYLYNVSAQLTGIADVDTGLKVIDKDSIDLYSDTTSRFEGTGTSPGVQKTSG